MMTIAAICATIEMMRLAGFMVFEEGMMI